MSAATERRRGDVFGEIVELVAMQCPSCAIVYAVPRGFRDNRRKDGESWYCPNGHSLSYHETDLDRERKAREEAEERARQAKATAEVERNWRAAEQADHARTRRKLAARKGQVTALKRRAAKGVCPCCSRTFSNLARHVAAVHPGYLAENSHAEAVVEPPEGAEE